jgi:hypothetical protein
MSIDTKPPMFWPVVILKRLLLLGWAVWLSLVFTTNVLDAAKAVGLLGTNWAFASGNFVFLCDTTKCYGTPAWLNGLLFAGVIAWEGLATGLFWLAAATFPRRDRRAAVWRYAAFTAALGLWLAFMIADEVFIAYPVERAHVGLFTAQLATLLAVELLPSFPRPLVPKLLFGNARPRNSVSAWGCETEFRG